MLAEPTDTMSSPRAKSPKRSASASFSPLPSPLDDLAQLQLDDGTALLADVQSQVEDGAVPNMETLPGDYLYLGKLKHEDGKAVIRFEVSNEFVGRIIGKQGSVIRELQDKSGAAIHMPKDDQVVGSHGREVTVTSSKESEVKHCCLLIGLKIVPKEEHDRLEAIRIALEEYQPTVSEVVHVPNEHVGRVIGKHGQTIREIQELARVRIELPKESNPGENFRVITITGSVAEVEYSKAIIRMRTTPKEEGGTAGPGSSHLAKDETTKMRIHVSDEMVGKIIGRRGQTIRDLQESTNTIVVVPKDCIPGTHIREVTLYGLPQGLNRCQHLLQERLSTHDGQMQPVIVLAPRWPSFSPCPQDEAHLLETAMKMSQPMYMAPLVPFVQSPVPQRRVFDVQQSPPSVPQAMFASPPFMGQHPPMMMPFHGFPQSTFPQPVQTPVLPYFRMSLMPEQMNILGIIQQQTGVMIQQVSGQDVEFHGTTEQLNMVSALLSN
jgi:predicted RNA-binding protein YlqC (UPF0109 family)